MNFQHFVGSALMIGAMAAGTSGCFATRMVRDDPGTEYTIVNVREIQALPAAVAVAPPIVVTAPAATDGTLVVEALAVPPPPAATMPVRLPAAIAAAGETHMARADVSPPAPAWGPLPSYVGQFTSGDWHGRSIFWASTQSSGSSGRWGGSRGRSSAGYTATYGSYGTSSSSAYFSGGSSSHFAGGGMSSGHFAGGGMSSGHFAGGH
jgi:hypothetical protein